MIKTQRDSNFELLRTVCILLILLMHSTSQASTDLSAFNAHLYRFISSVGNVGVSCFFLISGYFGIKLKWKQLLHIIILTTVYGLVSLIACRGIVAVGWKEAINQILIIPLYKNWFISVYLVLMLLSSYLNGFAASLTERDFRKMLLTLLVVLSVIPTIFNSAWETIVTSGGKCLSYGLFIYLTGRYIRLHKDIVVARRWTVGLFAASTLAINLLDYAVYYFLHRNVATYIMDCSLFIFISSVAVFYLFKSFTFQSKVINWVAGSVLAVYLLDGLRYTLDESFFHVSSYVKSPLLGVILFALASSTFITAIVVDKIRIWLLEKPEYWIIGQAVKAIKTIFTRIVGLGIKSIRL